MRKCQIVNPGKRAARQGYMDAALNIRCKVSIELEGGMELTVTDIAIQGQIERIIGALGKGKGPFRFYRLAQGSSPAGVYLVTATIENGKVSQERIERLDGAELVGDEADNIRSSLQAAQGVIVEKVLQHGRKLLTV